MAFASSEVCPLAGRPQRLEEAIWMIVIGVDGHKQSVTAVAVDEAGRMLGDVTVRVGSDELVGWATGLSREERLWAVEECRRLTRWLERQLLAAR